MSLFNPWKRERLGDQCSRSRDDTRVLRDGQTSSNLWDRHQLTGERAKTSLSRSDDYVS